MSLVAEPPSPQYVDRAVQTDPNSELCQDPLASPEVDERLNLLSPVTETEELHEHGSEMSIGAYSRASTPFGSAYSEPFDRSGTPSPEPTITTTTRVYKSVTSLGRAIGTTNSTTPRIASLPETVSRYSAKIAVQKATPRVVSTPLPSTGAKKLLLGSPTESDDELLLFSTNGETMSRMHALSQAPETPHTPSPVSSPESIVIIGNNNLLSDSFLRGDQTQTGDQKKAEPDDQGWISWASSPPRPIPALHGPLSLPYARCPSGAEGTIIEEPDNLPRMIWGLEGEGSQTSRPKESSSQPTAPTSTKSPVRSTHRSSKASVPPRLQPGASATPSDLDSQFMGLTVHDTPEPGYVSTEQRGAFPRQEPVNYPFCGQEPIDLAELVRNEMGLSHSDVSTNNALGHSGEHRAGMTVLNDLGSAWHNALVPADFVKDNGRLAVSNLVNQRLLQTPRISNPTGGSLGGYDLSSQAFPTLQVHAKDTPQASDRLTPRRKTALEIAQQYRQQQAQHRQQQSALPTPPNSSSPIWSSSFSPYPSSVVSPELLSNAAGLSKLSPPLVHPHSGNTLLGVSQQLGRGPLAALSDRQSEIDLLALASTAHLDDQHGLYAASPSLYTVSDTVEAYMRGQCRQHPDETVLHNEPSRSPAVPRPPPNTPYATMPRGYVVQHKLVPSSTMAAPPSPTSPQQPRTRALSSQQTRSVPITRLIQRRLSAVPEEDCASQLDDGVPPSMNELYARSGTRTLNFELPADMSVSQLHYLLSPPLAGQQIRMPMPASRREAARSANLSASIDGGLAEVGMHQNAVHVKLPASSTRRPAGPRNPRSDDRTHQPLGRKDASIDDSLSAGSARGRTQRRGGVRGRGRGGRTPTVSTVNRPERVDGGLMVKS